MGFEVVTRTHVGHRRKINEDALLSRPDLGLWAVADGMGGHDAGDIASAMVVEGLSSCPPGLAADAQAEAVRVLLQGVNARLREMGNEGPRARTIGSTVVVLSANAGAYVCQWAGDSRGYLARGGALVQLTRDHSLVQQLVDLGELTAAEAETHPDGNVVTRAVGADRALDVDSVSGEIAPGDAFILASDGLTRLVSPAELLAALQDADMEGAARRLLDACLDRGAPDNISFVILREA
ncbi:MAG: protein phosphatase 2C domain-containing protein [Caulobacteraceae bacterium]